MKTFAGPFIVSFLLHLFVIVFTVIQFFIQEPPFKPQISFLGSILSTNDLKVDTDWKNTDTRKKDKPSPEPPVFSELQARPFYDLVNDKPWENSPSEKVNQPKRTLKHFFPLSAEITDENDPKNQETMYEPPQEIYKPLKLDKR
ncbi:MAG: hypothetical protein KC713_04985 [Candidatus Omnitrophica bacterium]|nr:hypothetical protein [Candidatus Omnitrophota bacterium]